MFAGRQVWLIGMSLAVLSESAVSPSSAISNVRGLLLFLNLEGFFSAQSAHFCLCSCGSLTLQSSLSPGVQQL